MPAGVPPLPLTLWNATFASIGGQYLGVKKALLQGQWYIQVTGATTPASTTAFSLNALTRTVGTSTAGFLPEIYRGDGNIQPPINFGRNFQVQIEGANGRYRFDGVAPTTTIGMNIFSGAAPTLVTDWPALGSTLTEALTNIQFIAAAGGIYNFHFFDW